jgi:nucleotide-binding universal stress UspA family protein
MRLSKDSGRLLKSPNPRTLMSIISRILVATMHLVRGTPVPTVLTEVTRYSPQFVAVGRHEGTRLEPERPLMGCVGMSLAYHCPVDVLIVP